MAKSSNGSKGEVLFMKSAGLWILMSAPIHIQNRGEEISHQIGFKPLHHGLVPTFLGECCKEGELFFFGVPSIGGGLYIIMQNLCKVNLVWSINSLLPFFLVWPSCVVVSFQVG